MSSSSCCRTRRSSASRRSRDRILPNGHVAAVAVRLRRRVRTLADILAIDRAARRRLSVDRSRRRVVELGWSMSMRCRSCCVGRLLPRPASINLVLLVQQHLRRELSWSLRCAALSRIVDFCVVSVSGTCEENSNSKFERLPFAPSIDSSVVLFIVRMIWNSSSKSRSFKVIVLSICSERMFHSC